MKTTSTSHFLYKKYHHLYQKISKALRSGRFASYSVQKKKRVLARLERYESHLLRKGITVAGVATLMLGAPLLHAQGALPVGGEFQVNTYTTSVQSLPSIGVDSDGDFIITWTSYGQDGDGYGIYTQRYSSDGSPQGTEFQVNTYTTSVQRFPSIGVDSDGDFIITWQSYGQDGSSYGIYAQRYASDGSVEGSEFQVNTYTSSQQNNPSIAVDSDGDFIITWESQGQDGSFYGIYAQRYVSDGSAVGDEFQVNSYTTGNQRNPSIGVDSDGDFIITWQSFGQDGSSDGIYAQRYASDGSAVGSEFQVNTYTTFEQRFPSIALDSDGDFIITWTSFGQDGSNYGIYAQRYASDGTPQGSEFQVNTYTTSVQRNPSIALDSDGDFIITWQGYGQDGFGYYGIYAQRYDNNGNTVGTEFQVNTYTTDYQINPSIGVDSDGDFIITWQSGGQDGSGYGIYAQRYSTMDLVLEEVQVNTYTTSFQDDASVAMDCDGNFVVVWESYRQDGSENGVYGQRYNSDGSTNGGEFQINDYTTSFQNDASIAIDSNGSFVVVWESYGQDGSGYGIYAQRYNSDGTTNGGEFQINTYTTSDQDNPAVAIDNDGNFVVAWESYGQDGNYDGIYAQQYNSDGTTNGGEFQVNNYTTEDQDNPAVAIDNDGNFVVAWESYGQDGNYDGIYAQQYNSDGTTNGGEFQVNNYTTEDQDNPAVAIDNDGNFVIVWESSGQDGSGNGVYGQRYNSDGSTNGGEFQVNTYTSDDQDDAAVAMDIDGNFVVTWESSGQDGSYNGVYGQRYNSDGTPDGAEFQVNSYTTESQDDTEVAIDKDGDFVVVWESYGQDGDYNGVYARLYTNAPVADCPAPDINSLMAQTCEPPYFVFFDPVEEAVSYMSQITLESGEVINRCVPSNMISGKFNIPPRLQGMTVMVQLASVCVDPNTNEEFTGEFSEPREFTIGCDMNLTSETLEGRGENLPNTAPMIVAPNPVRDQLKLSFESSNRGIAELVIHDASGSRVQQHSVSVFEGYNEEDLDLTSLSAGTYFVQLRSKDGVQQVQFVKL